MAGSLALWCKHPSNAGVSPASALSIDRQTAVRSMSIKPSGRHLGPRAAVYHSRISRSFACAFHPTALERKLRLLQPIDPAGLLPSPGPSSRSHSTLSSSDYPLQVAGTKPAPQIDRPRAEARRTRIEWAPGCAQGRLSGKRTSGFRPTCQSIHQLARRLRNALCYGPTMRRLDPAAWLAPGRCVHALPPPSITSKISVTKSKGTRGWNTSDMLLTKTRRGFPQVSGVSSRSGSSWT